jgi:hypothetical protein
LKGADEDYVRVYVDGLYGYVREGKAVFSGGFESRMSVRLPKAVLRPPVLLE